MLLKRVYDEKDLQRYRTEQAKALKSWHEKLTNTGVPQELVESFAKQTVDRLITAPAATGVEIQHTGTTPEQNFSTNLVMDFLQNGIAEIRNKELILHAGDEDLRYAIKRTPGHYCLHCGAKLPSDDNGRLAREHVAQMHEGKASPDANNPAGYVAINHYETVLDAKQHERFRAQPAAKTIKAKGK